MRGSRPRRSTRQAEVELTMLRGKPLQSSVFAGPNGCGKSTAIEAVLLGFSMDSLIVRDLEHSRREEHGRITLPAGTVVALEISIDTPRRPHGSAGQARGGRELPERVEVVRTFAEHPFASSCVQVLEQIITPDERVFAAEDDRLELARGKTEPMHGGVRQPFRLGGVEEQVDKLDAVGAQDDLRPALCCEEQQGGELLQVAGMLKRLGLFEENSFTSRAHSGCGQLQEALEAVPRKIGRDRRLILTKRVQDEVGARLKNAEIGQPRHGPLERADNDANLLVLLDGRISVLQRSRLADRIDIDEVYRKRRGVVDENEASARRPFESIKVVPSADAPASDRSVTERRFKGPSNPSSRASLTSTWGGSSIRSLAVQRTSSFFRCL